jgi:predicted nucleic acid-binding protein
VRVLVDTTIWSEFFRRAAPEAHIHGALRRLIEAGECILIGPIRQEILSGIKNAEQFDRLKAALASFPDEPVRSTDYERAAAMFNQCRQHGIQGSNTDFLICATSARLSASIFTLDKDFVAFERVLPIRLYRLDE